MNTPITVAASNVCDTLPRLADALDMLGNALVYGFSLFVLARSTRWQAGAALVLTSRIGCQPNLPGIY